MDENFFFDFDETLFKTNHLSVRYINARYGACIPEDTVFDGNRFEDALNEHLPPNMQVTRDDFYRDFNDNFLVSQEWHDAAEPTEGSREFVKDLSKLGKCWIVTARCCDCRHIVKSLCDRYFSGLIHGMHFVWNRVSADVFEQNETKLSFISRMITPRSFFVDDNPNEIERVKKSLPAYLFDPRGVHVNKGDFKRIKKFSEIKVHWPPIGHA